MEMKTMLSLISMIKIQQLLQTNLLLFNYSVFQSTSHLLNGHLIVWKSKF